MKKIILLCLIVLQAFVYSAQATTYLISTTNFCYENANYVKERIELDKDFTFKLWANDILQYEGRWEFEDEEGNAINATIEFGDSSIEIHLRVVEKGRGLADRNSGDRYVFPQKIEFEDAEYVKDEYCY